MSMNILAEAKNNVIDLILYMFFDAKRIGHDRYLGNEGLQILIDEIVAAEEMIQYHDDIEVGVRDKLVKLKSDKMFLDEWFYSCYGKWLQKTYRDLVKCECGEEAWVSNKMFDKK